MWQQKERIENLRMKVLVISFQPPQQKTTGPFVYCSDSERKLYRHFGMLKAGFWDLWGPSSLFAYLQLLLKGRKIEPSTADIHQRGGDVLIDPQGWVRFHHIGRGPADRPNIETIFQVIERG